MAMNLMMARDSVGNNRIITSDSSGALVNRPYMLTTQHDITDDSNGLSLSNQLNKGSSTESVDMGSVLAPRDISVYIYANGLSNEPNADDKWGFQISKDNTNWMDLPMNFNGVFETHSNDSTNSKRSAYGRVENITARYVRLQSARDSAGSCQFGFIKLVVEEKY